MDEETLDARPRGEPAVPGAVESTPPTETVPADQALTAEIPLASMQVDGAHQPEAADGDGDGGAESPDLSYLHRLDALGFDQIGRGEARKRARQPTELADVSRSVASFFLTGFTTVELVAIAIAYLGLVAFLWMTDVITLDRLFLDPLLRSVMLLLAVAMLRPITWIPYAAVFVGLRRVVEAAAPRQPRLVRNAVAGGATIAILLVGLAVSLAAIDGSGRMVRSAVHFVLGGGSFNGIGSGTFQWTFARVMAVLATVVLGRVFLPPLDLDLNLSDEPILGYPTGRRRDRLDRWLLAAALIMAAVLTGIGLAGKLTG